MTRHPKRFYRTADVAPAEQGGFRVLLDGRPALTPAGAALIVPSPALAVAIAGEWNAQESAIAFPDMPLTRLAFTAIDRVSGDRSAILDQIVAYARSDVLSYRAAAPAELAERQKQTWDPLLAWAAAEVGVVLRTGEGVTHIAQPETSLAKLREAAEHADDFQLAALHAAVIACGSALIGLALLRGKLDAKAAFAVAHLDEIYQAEKWGEDPEAARAAGRKRAELEIIERSLRLMRE